MDLPSKEFLLNRIFSGMTKIIINDVSYVAKHPTRLDRYRAQDLYRECIYKNRYENWYNKKTILKVLDENDIFLLEDEEKLKKLDKDEESLKVQLFESTLNLEKQDFIRKTLDRVRGVKRRLLTEKHCLDYLTVEGFGSLIKNQYIISKTLFYEDGDEVFTKSYLSEDDKSLIEAILFELGRLSLSSVQMRELARGEPWRGYWGVSKENVFGKAIVDLNDEQRNLILYSKMYDGAFEHPECPSDEIINDDDMFDGWMIYQRKQREANKSKKDVSSLIGEKQRNAEEIYLMAPTEATAERIDNMNTREAQLKRRLRDNKIKRAGLVSEANLPDKRQQIRMQANREWASQTR